MPKHNFIGYATLEKLAQVMDVTRPVYATATQNPGKPDRHGMYLCRAEIVVEQPDDRGDVHYCVLLIGRYTVLIHAPYFDSSKGKIVARQAQAFQLVNDFLTGMKGFTVREAQISKPENVRLLEGWFDALVYDKVTEKFHLEFSDLASMAPADESSVFAANDQLVSG